jgi:hypothetical protein
MTRDEMWDDMIAKEQIRQAMARYARGVDRRDEALIRTAYHEDSVDDHGLGFSGTGYELAASVNNLPSAWENIIHLLGQHLIEVDGDEAVSEVYFTNHQIMRDDEGREWDWQTCGRYLDRWERRDGEFKIKNRRVVIDRMRTEENAARWPGPDHDVPKHAPGLPPLDAEAVSTMVFGTHGLEDVSYAFLGLARDASGALR